MGSFDRSPFQIRQSREKQTLTNPEQDHLVYKKTEGDCLHSEEEQKTGESWTELGLGSFVQFQRRSAAWGYQVCLVEGQWVIKVEVAYEL